MRSKSEIRAEIKRRKQINSPSSLVINNYFIGGLEAVLSFKEFPRDINKEDKVRLFKEQYLDSLLIVLDDCLGGNYTVSDQAAIEFGIEIVYPAYVDFVTLKAIEWLLQEDYGLPTSESALSMFHPRVIKSTAKWLIPILEKALVNAQEDLENLGIW